MTPDHFEKCLLCGTPFIKYKKGVFTDTCDDCIIKKLEFKYFEAYIQILELYKKWGNKNE